MSIWDRLFSKKKVSEVSSLLKEIPLFAELSSYELSLLEQIVHQRSYGSGEAVFRDGDPGVGFYIVKEGRINILSSKPEMILTELADGDFFGEIAILNDLPRSATARAKAPTSILAFFKADLFQLMRDNPKLGFSIISALSRIVGDRLVAANELNDSLRSRLANFESGESPSASTIGI